MVWVESAIQRVWHGSDPHGPGFREAPKVASRVVLARVVEGGREGCYETGGGSVGELADALRMAIASSRVTPPTTPAADLLDPDSEPPPPEDRSIFDRQAARLERAAVQQRLGELAEPGERAKLTWSRQRVFIINSRGLRRRAESTCARLLVVCGDGPGSGSAHFSARSLAELDHESIFARARERHAAGIPRDAAVPAVDLRGIGAASQVILLSAEATGLLVWLLGQAGFSAAAFHQSPARSRLAEWLGKPLFNKQIHLVDDATNPAVLPFPFDLEGRTKRPVELITEGVLRTPAVDARLAKELGLAATPHRLGPGEARPIHLVLTPGAASLTELLHTADGGISIDRLEGLEAYDPSRLRFRATVRGLRRIENGRLTEPLADTIWEDSLDRVFRDVATLGSQSVLQAKEGGMGGVLAPSLLLAPPGVRHA